MASTSAPQPSAKGPATQTVLPDEIWEEIFLRLDAVADLARASAACTSFHRVVSERRFLRRFRSMHPPAVLGFIRRNLGFISRETPSQFVPVEPPHRSAPEARALDQAADFTFSFLPDLTFSFVPDLSQWYIRHAFDGRVLLSTGTSSQKRFEDFLVCDPLHRRYVKIPRMPEDLMASIPVYGSSELLPFLTPAAKNDEEESFRVIYTTQFKDKVAAFVFSSCNQTWRGIISTICLPNGYEFIEYVPYYAHGCLYWMVSSMGYSVIFDTSEMEFSVIDLPPHNFDSRPAIVEAEEGGLRFLTIADGTVDLYCKNWQSNGVGAQEVQHEKKLIPVPKDSGVSYSHWAIMGNVGCYIALLGSRQISHELKKSEYFVLDTKTLLIEKVCTLSNVEHLYIPYARFPPPFALPSI